MNTTLTIEKSRETVVVTGSSGLFGSAFIDHVGEDYTAMGFDCKGPPRPALKTAHPILRLCMGADVLTIMSDCLRSGTPYGIHIA